MPEICRFLGIIIVMYYNDHEPPHFHARYGGREAVIGICDGGVIDGWLPPRALGLVQEWRSMHVDDLLRDWHLAREHKPLERIAPLE